MHAKNSLRSGQVVSDMSNLSDGSEGSDGSEVKVATHGSPPPVRTRRVDPNRALRHGDSKLVRTGVAIRHLDGPNCRER